MSEPCKEQGILDKAVMLNAKLQKVRYLIDEAISRGGAAKSSGVTDAPLQPNKLDAILTEQNESLSMVDTIEELFTTEILNKL